MREIIRQSDNFTMTFTCPAGGEVPPHLGVAYRFFLSVKEFAARCVNSVGVSARSSVGFFRRADARRKGFRFVCKVRRQIR